MTVSEHPGPGRVPWGLADMGMALGAILVASIFLLVPVVTAAAFIAGDSDLTENQGALALVLGANMLLELFLVASVALFTVRKYNVSWADLGVRLPGRGGIWLPLALFGGALVAVYVYFAVLAAVGVEPEGNIPDAAFGTPLLAALVGVLSLLFAPIMEELFFRGFIFGGLRGRWGVVWAALASGFLFSLVHVSPSVFIPFTAVGFIFAWGYAYSGSLFASIVAHFLFNLVSFIIGVVAA